MHTSNPIESTFATVRLRTDKTKGCLSRDTALASPGPAGPVSSGDRRKGLLAFAGCQARQVGRASLAQAQRRQPSRPADPGRRVSQWRARSRRRGKSRRLTPYTKIDHSSASPATNCSSGDTRSVDSARQLSGPAADGYTSLREQRVHVAAARPRLEGCVVDGCHRRFSGSGRLLTTERNRRIDRRPGGLRADRGRRPGEPTLPADDGCDAGPCRAG